MSKVPHAPAAAWIVAVGLLAGGASSSAQIFSGHFELSGSVHLNEADSSVRAHLERVKAYVADRQWDEAVETFRQVMENHGPKVIALADRRYISVADYCQAQIASLPAPGLELYRQRVDPLAAKWYEEGIAQRDSARLLSVVHQAFASSSGDEALLALAEISLEQGDCGAARGFLEKLLERPPQRISATDFKRARERQDLEAADAERLDHWYRADESLDPPVYRLRHDEYLPDEACTALVSFWKEQRLPSTRLAYPGTSLDLADVRARLVLVSILEGSLERARSELEAMQHLHPNAEGQIAGRKANYVAALGSLIARAQKWPTATAGSDWSTFAGSPARDKTVSHAVDVGAPRWAPIELGEPLSADIINSRTFSSRRVAEDAQGLLSYHPLVVGDLLLYNNAHRVYAFSLRSGEPAWPRDPKIAERGEIFRGEVPAGALNRPAHGLGVPRFTMTAHDGKLYARMGSQVSSWPAESNDDHRGYVVCLDLDRKGGPVELWTLKPDDDKWAFEGSPLVDGSSLYIAMRRSDVRPQAHVACFDAETRRLRWRTMICSAETPGGGQSEEMTHNLLTLEQGALYYNTNLGAVAALSAADGHIDWISVYPRAKQAGPLGQDRRAAHFYRDLNPAIFHRGLLIVAPSDSESIFALDAGTGELAWDSPLAEDAVHLLGVGHGSLFASGDHLWCIDAARGKVLARWPDDTPHGYGRGVLADGKVFWPTREKLYVFDQQIRDHGTLAMAREPIELAEGRRATGGNLLMIGDVLLIATATKLFAFDEQPGNAAPLAQTIKPAAKTPLEPNRPR